MALMLFFVLFPFYWIMVTSFKSDLQISQRTSIFYAQPVDDRAVPSTLL